ncbi:MAG: formylglycine-generating enzyme family protein [Bradymonadia bacterium]
MKSAIVTNIITHTVLMMGLLAACTGDVSVQGGESQCESGAVEPCSCGEGSPPGTATCEGGRLGECVCSEADAGPGDPDMAPPPDMGPDGPRCTSGIMQPCPCPDGTNAMQTCGEDGTFGQCACADAGVEPIDACPEWCAGQREVCGRDLDEAACLTACAALPTDGARGDTLGHSVQCRNTHLRLAPRGAREQHCLAARIDGGGICGSACDVYCDLMMAEGAACGGTYTDRAECETTCAGFADNGRSGEGAGDTVQCRLDHLQAAIEATAGAAPAADVATHCEAAGPEGGSFCRPLNAVSCAEYCEEVLQHCPNAHSNLETCLSACDTFPFDGTLEEAPALRVGHTLQCRMYHGLAAARDPAGHCEAAGTAGGGVCGALCDVYCDLTAAHCPDTYADESRCQQACRLMAAEAPAGLRHGPNVPCRIHHAIRAAVTLDEGDKATLCAHASAAGVDGQGQCGECLHRSYACFGPDTYRRGSPLGLPGSTDQESPHLVSLEQPFMMLKTELTQRAWVQYAGFNPSGNIDCPPSDPDCDLDSYPIEGVDWYHTLALANAVSLDEGLPHCYAPQGNPARPYDFDDAAAQTAPAWIDGYACEGYRVPTEAEWEYVAKSGGKNISYPWGNEEATCIYAAMNAEGLGGCGRQRNFEVCSFAEGLTDQGVCDMSGNVWEWTYDWGSGDYQFDDPSVPLVNPVGPENVGDHFRVIRGGSISTDWRSVRAGHRFGVPPTQSQIDLGFRLVRTLPADGADLSR